MEHVALGELGLVEIADLGDRRFLGVGERLRHDARLLVGLSQALHGELDGGFERFLVSHAPYSIEYALESSTRGLRLRGGVLARRGRAGGRVAPRARRRPD